MKNLWIVSMEEDATSFSHGACQSWGTFPPPENYAYISNSSENGQTNFFDEYYKKENANGVPYKSAGHVVMEYDDCTCEGYEGTAKIVASCIFSDEKYNAYRDSLPSEVPGLIAGLVNSADGECATKINEGTVPNSVATALAFSDIDGNPVEEPPVFMYTAENQQALQNAVIAVTNGATSAKVQFTAETRPVKMTREQVLRLYLEMQQFVLQQESYTIAFKAMVNAHKDDDRHQADYLREHYVYGMELEADYQTMFENEMNDGMEQLMAMAENWGINE